MASTLSDLKDFAVACIKAAPDGYTLLTTTSGTVWQNRVLFSKLPYNLDKDIVPVAVFPSIVTINYKGESPMWVDVASGRIQVAIGSFQAFNTVALRGVKAIGVTGSYRSPKLPDVPTLVEQGVPGRLVQLEGGLPLMAPAGTPEAVLRALNQVAVEGANTSRAARMRETFAIPNKPKNLAETRADWERDVPLWVKLAVDLGIKLD